jgi:hypothetical protein
MVIGLYDPSVFRWQTSTLAFPPPPPGQSPFVQGGGSGGQPPFVQGGGSGGQPPFVQGGGSGGQPPFVQGSSSADMVFGQDWSSTPSVSVGAC